MTMRTEKAVLTAFEQLSTLVGTEEALELVHCRSGLSDLFLRQHWDEKVFKISDDDNSRGGTSSGNWLARVIKQGPELILSNTIDPTRREIRVAGSQFWKHFLAALDRCAQATPANDSGKNGQGERPSVASRIYGLASGCLGRWDRRNHVKWTQAPAWTQAPVRTQARTPLSKKMSIRAAQHRSARQLYSLYYQ